MKKTILGLLIVWMGWILLSYSASEYFFRDEGYSSVENLPKELRDLYIGSGFYSLFNESLFNGLLVVGVAATIVYVGVLLLKERKR